MDAKSAEAPNEHKKINWIRVNNHNPQRSIVRSSKSNQARKELEDLVNRYQLKYRKRNDDFDLFSDFEKQFNNLRLNDDEEFSDILDRAQRRDIPTSIQIRLNNFSKCTLSHQNNYLRNSSLNSSLSSTMFFDKSDTCDRPSSRLSQGSSTNSTLRRSKMPDSISDDVVNRKERSYHMNQPTTSGSHFYAFSPNNSTFSQHKKTPSSSESNTRSDSRTATPTLSSSPINVAPNSNQIPSTPLSYSNLVTYDSSFEQQYRPHPLSLCVYCSNTLVHSSPNDGCPANGYKPSPNLILDDVLYRKIKQSPGAKTSKKPEPLFGIPNSIISKQINDNRINDYLRLTPQPRSLHHLPPYTTGRSWNRPHRTPNLINDDLAFRSLRKDLFDHFNEKISHSEFDSHKIDNSFSNVRKIRTPLPPEYKKMHKRNRKLKKFSFVEDFDSLESSESQESPESNWSDSSILI